MNFWEYTKRVFTARPIWHCRAKGYFYNGAFQPSSGICNTPVSFREKDCPRCGAKINWKGVKDV